MISRVTNQALMRAAHGNLQSNMAQLARLQEQASGQKAITKPSDDPTAAAQSMRVRSEMRATDQYSRNINDGSGWLNTVDSTLATAVGLVGRVRDLTVRGANDASMSPTAKEAIAAELESLRTELLTVANTTYLGRSIFAGNSDAGAAFNADLSYNGAPGSTVERRIDSNTLVRVDADGAEIFGTDTDSLFALIDNIVTELRSGVNIGSRLTEIDDRMTIMFAAQATVGTRHAQVLRAEEANMGQSISLEAQRSGIEDVDLARVLLDLKLQEVGYQSALAVTARTLQPTLMDFLR